MCGRTGHKKCQFRLKTQIPFVSPFTTVFGGEADFDFSNDAIAMLRCKASNNDLGDQMMGHLIAAWKSCFVFLCSCCKFFVYKSWFVVMVV